MNETRNVIILSDSAASIEYDDSVTNLGAATLQQAIFSVAQLVAYLTPNILGLPLDSILTETQEPVLLEDSNYLISE